MVTGSRALISPALLVSSILVLNLHLRYKLHCVLNFSEHRTVELELELRASRSPNTAGAIVHYPPPICSCIRTCSTIGDSAESIYDSFIYRK